MRTVGAPHPPAGHGHADPAEASGTPPPVAVIVPCYNEASAIPSLVARLGTLRRDGGRDWDIVFVDDGSVDGTAGRLDEAVRVLRPARVLRHAANRGLGAALRTGLGACAAPIVCTIDGDCSYPPERLPDLVRLLDDGCEIATASTWHPASAGAVGHPVRLRLSHGASRLYRRLLREDVHTFTCLFRAYRREALERLAFRADGFVAVTEIMVLGLLAGYRVRELPMPLARRAAGRSKFAVGRALGAHAALLAATCAALARRRLAGVRAP